MIQTLNLSNWQELWQQTSRVPPTHLVLDDFEEYAVVPSEMGWGYSHAVYLAPGIEMEWTDRKFHRDWRLKVPPHEHLVQSEVYLSGLLPDETGYPILGGDRSYFSGSGISPGYLSVYSPSQHLIWVNIELTPEAFTDFFVGLPEANESLLKVLIKPEDWKVSFFPPVTPRMRQLAQEIFLDPYRGTMRLLYLQEKVFELLTLQLQPILADRRLCDCQPGLKPDTIARVYHAKELLQSRLVEPPTLLDLARFVGVSERTLRSGFRDLFGTTVVGYLNQQRMLQAQQLLRQQHRTVAEVANQVGYSHLGHFAAGFKRQFGITPRECLSGKPVPNINS